MATEDTRSSSAREFSSGRVKSIPCRRRIACFTGPAVDRRQCQKLCRSLCTWLRTKTSIFRRRVFPPHRARLARAATADSPNAVGDQAPGVRTEKTKTARDCGIDYRGRRALQPADGDGCSPPMRSPRGPAALSRRGQRPAKEGHFLGEREQSVRRFFCPWRRYLPPSRSRRVIRSLAFFCRIGAIDRYVRAPALFYWPKGGNGRRISFNR